MDILKLWLHLKKLYTGTFGMFTKSDMSGNEGLIRPLPDLYLRRKNRQSKKPHYFVQLAPASTYSHKLRKRLNKHMDCKEEYGDTKIWLYEYYADGEGMNFSEL